MRRVDKRVMVNIDLTEAELDAWKHHPDTFFGELRPYHRPAKDAMDLYQFFHATYANTPREKLLEYTDIAELKDMPQAELAKRNCYALAVSVAKDGTRPGAPAWQQRLRPIKK